MCVAVGSYVNTSGVTVPLAHALGRQRLVEPFDPHHTAWRDDRHPQRRLLHRG